MDSKEKTIKIILLDDGETWADEADIITLSQEGYDKLQMGRKFYQLEENDIIDSEPIYG